MNSPSPESSVPAAASNLPTDPLPSELKLTIRLTTPEQILAFRARAAFTPEKSQTAAAQEIFVQALLAPLPACPKPAAPNPTKRWATHLSAVVSIAAIVIAFAAFYLVQTGATATKATTDDHAARLTIQANQLAEVTKAAADAQATAGKIASEQRSLEEDARTTFSSIQSRLRALERK